MSKKQVSVPGTGSVARSPASRYFDDFKRDAVRLVCQEKYSFKAAAAAVNVSEKSLREWHARFAAQSAPCRQDANLDELREKNKRLRQQLKRAEREREILPLDWATLCDHVFALYLLFPGFDGSRRALILVDLLDVVDHAQRVEYSLLACRKFFEPVNRRETFLLADPCERRRQTGRRVGAVLHAGSSAFVLRRAGLSRDCDPRT